MSASARSSKRGSPEAVAKRRAARKFNDVALSSGSAHSRLDGRTEKRRQRLLKEVGDGEVRGIALKPVDLLLRLAELLTLGETLASLRKVTKARKVPTLSGESVERALGDLHAAYRFEPELYRFIGFDPATLKAAGVLGTGSSKRRG